MIRLSINLRQAGWKNVFSMEGDAVDLGTLGGTISNANGINNKGEIVGRSTLTSGAIRRDIKVSPLSVAMLHQPTRVFNYMEGINGGYRIHNQAAIHFITFAVVDWVDVFTRKSYRDVVVDSLRYCRQHKRLRLHCWCIMSNHLHLIASASHHNLSDVLRDFKTHTSKQIVSAIINNATESRREWMLDIFRKHGQQNSRNTNHQFWRQDNQPKELYSAEFVAQKINYIHNNPVEAGIVDKPEDYIYSSARDYKLHEKCGLLDVEFI